MPVVNVPQLVWKAMIAWVVGVIVGFALDAWLSKADGLVIVRPHTSFLVTYSRIGFWGGLLGGYVVCGLILAKAIIEEIHPR
jgi:hypothetical protein